MLGFVAGIFLALTYVGLSAGHDWGMSAGALASYAIPLFGVPLVVGFVFRYTIGFIAMWAMFGAAVASIIEFVNGNVAYGFSLLAHVLALWGIGQVLRALDVWQERRWLASSQTGPQHGAEGKAQRGWVLEGDPSHLHSSDERHSAASDIDRPTSEERRAEATARQERLVEEKKRVQAEQQRKGKEWLERRATEKERRRQERVARREQDGGPQQGDLR